MTKTTITAIRWTSAIGCIIAALATAAIAWPATPAATATTFIDPGTNPTWNRFAGAYRQALNYCDESEVVELHWQLVLNGNDPAGRWAASEDHRVHTFTLDPYEHWNVPPESIKTERLDEQGRYVVTWYATYPDTANTPRMKIDQAWVELEQGGDVDALAEPGDELRLVALAPCVAVGSGRVDRWAVEAGNPDVKPAP